MSAGGRARLTPAEAYRLWAPTYEAESAVSALEDRVVRGVMPELAGKRLLDVGCGTGRRLVAAEGAALAVGVDLVPEMLAAAPRAVGRSCSRVAGDARRLPFADGTFDVIWCRLVLGHVANLELAYREISRVGRLGTQLLVSDFHPAAIAAGHRRTFHSPDGRVVEVEHHVHDLERHDRAGAAVGWRLTSTIEAPAGEPERSFYSRAGRMRQFAEESSLPLVLVLRFDR